MPLRHVLTVYDGTTESEDLLDMVCRIARSQRAQLTILYVRLVPLKERLPSYEPGKDPEADALVAQAEKMANRRGVRAASAVRYARGLGAAVVAEARVRGVDLVALPFSESDWLAARRIGADVEAVLSRATCGVMLYRPGR